MRRSQPSRLATWLLTRMTSSPTSESLIGDLVEQFHRGHSSTWYWRQVVTSILADTAKEFRRHPILAVRANVVGFSVLVALQTGILSLIRNRPVHGALWVAGRWIQPAQWWPSPMLVWYLCLPVAGLFCGWLVGRLHQAHRIAMTRVFAGCFIAFQVVQVCIWLATVDWSVEFNLGHYAISSLILFVTILFSGLWGTPADGQSQLPQLSIPTRNT